jgi:hypothetical protein
VEAPSLGYHSAKRFDEVAAVILGLIPWVLTLLCLCPTDSRSRDWEVLVF